jgi:hypothetical protein
MRLQFWTCVGLAALAVACTTAREDVAQSVPTPPPYAKTIRCAATADVQPQSDPCSAKTMAGQRVQGTY